MRNTKRSDNQGELFPKGEAYARGSDPGTSHAAAAHVSEHSATKLEYIALRALRDNADDGLTNHELVEITGVDWNTITPRLAPLVRKGLAFDSGKRRKGPTNRPCIVWKPL